MTARAVSRGWLLTAFLLPLVLLAAWGGWWLTREAPPAVRVGEPAPAFALADLDGQPVRLADLRGRPVVLNFWASWCAECLDEFPLLREALARHADADLAVVGIVFRDRSEAAREFMQRMGARWPVAMDPGEVVATRYAIAGPPQSVFIGRDGIVRGLQIGPFDADDLQRQLELILGEE